MRRIGFSTGALALADYCQALLMLEGTPVDALELSALREDELLPLLAAIDYLDLSQFGYISIHAPSQFSRAFEPLAVERLTKLVNRGWPIVAHPDTITDWSLWRHFGPQLCVENMDKRKPVGRTVREMEYVFEKVPDASFCFDIGHARQVDSTMTEAYLLLTEFSERLVQAHVSEVNTSSKHDRLSLASTLAFQEVAHLIPERVPLILETPVTAETMLDEMQRVLAALPVPSLQAA